MMQALIIVIFLMAIGWFILLAVIFNRLKKYHPIKLEMVPLVGAYP